MRTSPIVDRTSSRALWQRAAERAAPRGRHLLLVVDGLDEDLRPPGLPSVAAILPSRVGGSAHVLVASRPHPELPSDVPGGHPLVARQRWKSSRSRGLAELAGLARQEIDELTLGDEPELAVDVLGLLTAAAGPLVASRSGDHDAMTWRTRRRRLHRRQIRRLLTEQAARSLQPVGPPSSAPLPVRPRSRCSSTPRPTADLSDPGVPPSHPPVGRAWRDADWRHRRRRLSEHAAVPARQLPVDAGREPQRLAALVSDCRMGRRGDRGGGRRSCAGRPSSRSRR